MCSAAGTTARPSPSDSRNDGEDDGRATINSAGNFRGDTSQLIEATARLQEVNDRIKNGEHVSDADYDYLNGYFDKVASWPEAINNIPPDALAADGTPLRTYLNQQYADGMLNLIKGSEQNTDSGVAPGGSSGRQLSVAASSIAGILNQLEPSPEIELARSKYQGMADGQATVAATQQKTITDPKYGNTDDLIAATDRLQEINDRIKNGEHVSDADYAYLYAYYDATANDSAAIDNAVKQIPSDATAADGTSLRDSVGARYADGLLNLSKACDQNADSGASSLYPSYGPDGSTVFAGRGGYYGLPPAVLDIMKSDIGKVQKTPQYNGGEAPEVRRAEWVGGADGHWVVDNYDRDTGFGDLLSYASKDVEGSAVFSQQLAATAIRWKQDTNAVQSNTENWLGAVHQLWGNPGFHGPDKKEVELGFPPDRNHADPNSFLDLSDTSASGLLTAASHNQTASAQILLDDDNRRAILGLNWQGHGAADLIESGTAPDPAGTSQCNEAALKVIQDAGSDYLDFANVVSDPVKEALTYIAVTHLASFDATPGSEFNQSKIIDDLSVPGEPPIHGLALTNNDAANYLKLISLCGPKYSGTVHAAAIELGAEWLQAGQTDGHGAGSGAEHAATLLGRVSSSEYAAAIDMASALSGDQQQEYINQIAEQQKQARDAALLNGVLNVVYAGVNFGTLGVGGETAQVFTGVMAAISAAENYDQYAGAGQITPDQQQIINNSEQIQQLWDTFKQSGQVRTQVDSDLQAAALMAAGENPSLAYGSDGGAGDSSPINNAVNTYYGAGDGGWGFAEKAIDRMTPASDKDSNTVTWTDGSIVAETNTGDNKIIEWETKLVVTAAGGYTVTEPKDVTPG